MNQNTYTKAARRKKCPEKATSISFTFKIHKPETNFIYAMNRFIFKP